MLLVVLDLVEERDAERTPRTNANNFVRRVCMYFVMVPPPPSEVEG